MFMAGSARGNWGTRWELEAALSDRKVELADMETVSNYVADLRNLLDESSLVERKSFIRSFVREVRVRGVEVLLNYTIPLSAKGVTEDTVVVPPIVHYGGPSDPIAQPKIKTFFELSVVPSLPLKVVARK